MPGKVTSVSTTPTSEQIRTQCCYDPGQRVPPGSGARGLRSRMLFRFLNLRFRIALIPTTALVLIFVDEVFGACVAVHRQVPILERLVLIEVELDFFAAQLRVL